MQTHVTAIRGFDFEEEQLRMLDAWIFVVVEELGLGLEND